jgi:hypothetical protein
MIRSALTISKQLSTKDAPLVTRVRSKLTVIPTHTFDQSDTRIYPHAHKQCNEDKTQNIASRLLISSANRIDKIAHHTRWRHPRWHQSWITHRIVVEDFLSVSGFTEKGSKRKVENVVE